MTLSSDNISGETILVPDDQRARQAVASLGGHLFQATRAAIEWVQLADDATLLIEVAEDYAVLARDALAMTQTKQEYGAAVTLRSDGVRKSLAGLVAFQDANPGKRVSLAYLTTALPGVEARSELPGAEGGIQYWQDVARGGDIVPLRKLLLDTQLDEAVLKRLREADDESLRSTIVQSVTWLTGSPGLEPATAFLDARLRALGVERTGFAADGETARPLLIHRILRTAVAEDRRLTRDDFEQEWARATTVPVSVTMLRGLAGVAGADGLTLAPLAPPPSLSPRTAPRRALIDGMRAEFLACDVIWLHGSSGLGKSQLARLIEARDNGRWEFVALRDCDAAEQTRRLRNALGRVAGDDFAGLILDDVLVPASEEVRRWIAAACVAVSRVPGARIVVTSEREPLPQIRRAFEPLRVQVRDAPYLELDDVRDIVAAAGGDPETWAMLVRVSCGGGHPLLVDARVAGLASKQWPAGERLNGFGVGDGPSEIADVRREVSLRLLDELSADAHLLLLRLSGLIGSFDLRLVDAAAAIDPPVQRARPLFDLLVGPWIEMERTDRYRLSPLLQSAAASLSDAQRTTVHVAAIDDLTKRNPFPGDMLSSFILYVIVTRHMVGFMFIARLVMSAPRHPELAFSLLPLVFMKSGEGGLLVPEHPGVSAMVRTAQVIAAVNADPPAMVPSVVAEALAEARKLDDLLRGANTFTTLMAVLGSERADLPPRTWMPMLVQFNNLLTGGGFPAEMTEMLADVDLDGLKPDEMFFAVRSNKIDTLADLEELFDELGRIDPDWRRSLLEATAKLFGGPPLFVQSAWSRETTTDTLDASRAEQVYRQLADQARAWGEDEIAIECFRSRAVMLDEYLGRPDDALAVLDQADALFGHVERLVRSRAAVLATMGRHEEELALLSTLTPGYSAEEPLERLMMLRTAAISAGKLERFGQSAQLFQDAYDAAKGERPEVLGASVRPGLLADAACMETRNGRMADAVGNLIRAIEVVDGDLSDDPSLLFARAAITQVTQWIAARIEGREFPEDPSLTPGVCSTLRPTFKPDELQRRTVNQEWYLLARLETLVGVDAGAERRLLELERVNGVQLGLALGVAATQAEAFIALPDPARLLAILPRYAWISGRRFASGGKVPVVNPEDQVSPDQWGDVEVGVARAAVSGMLGTLLLEGRQADADRASADAAEMSDALMFEVGGGAPPVHGADLFATGLASLHSVMSDRFLNAEELFRDTVQAFIWLKHVGAGKLSANVYAVLVRRWLDLCENHRAILSNPRLAIPAIEVAAGLVPDLAALARLAEAARLASSRGVPPNILEMLRTTV
ncbi:MAG: hypothetical protein JWO15_431 [Sphingomonadales bacterium]|nr:hypothetical protein [Sphingomonadales bacterium]